MMPRMKKKKHQLFHKFLSCELLLTTSCNISCTYCIARDLDAAIMDNEVGKAAIDMFISLSDGAKLLGITFTGGEPLLYFPSLKFLTNYARLCANDAGMKVDYVLKTNGTILNNKIIAFLAEQNFKVVVSIDGLPKIHNKFRKGSGGQATQQKVIMNIKKLFQNKVLCVASLTVHPSQAHQVIENIRYLHKLGALQIDVGPVYGTVTWPNKTVFAFIDSLQNVAIYMRDVNSKGDHLEVGPLYKQSEHVGEILSDQWGCGAALTNLAFLPDGRITGCSALAMLVPKFPNLVIGDVETGLNDLALRHFLQQSHAQGKDRPLCKKCETAPNCRGGCLAINLATNCMPFSPPSFYCQTMSSIPTAWNIAWGDLDQVVKKEIKTKSNPIY